MIYEVTMEFSKPPVLTVVVEAPNTITAKMRAQHSAIEGGFGKAKKFLIVEQK